MPVLVRNWTVLIVLSIAFGGLLLWLHAPAALMLGPLVAGIVLSSSGGKVTMPAKPFVVAQGLVGLLIANMVPVTIVGDVLRHWVLFGFGVLSVVAVTVCLGWVMTRLQLLPGTTALWGTSPGAASVMTIMAESYGADVRLVALMQYTRVVGVAAVAAILVRLFGISSPQAHHAVIWFPALDWLGLAETFALAVVGPIIAMYLRIPAGAFLVPLVIGAVLHHFSLVTIVLPPWLMAGCYALVGWNVGLRFSRQLLLHAARTLPQVIGTTLVLIAVCGAIAGVMVVVAGVDPLTAYLATSPGGSDSIAIIAASTNVDVSFVMAMQTVRMLSVLFLAPALTKFVASHRSVVRYRNDRPS
ncbi:MAG TPA: AbrB family transcriptional regulator [Reyranella sp.]|nr:AbrB family transcriptional regulator [Reyranella sp.]